MRFKNLCVHVDLAPPDLMRFRARCFMYEGKSDIVYGRSLCLRAKTVSDVERAVIKNFENRARQVYVTFAPELNTLNRMIEFYDGQTNIRILKEKQEKVS